MLKPHRAGEKCHKRKSKQLAKRFVGVVQALTQKRQDDGGAGMRHQPCAGLDQPLSQRGQRPDLDLRGRCQRAQKGGQVVGQRMTAVAAKRLQESRVPFNACLPSLMKWR